MDNENYILITGWMVNELKLKGSELFVYALIYGFSQDGIYNEISANTGKNADNLESSKRELLRYGTSGNMLRISSLRSSSGFANTCIKRS